MPSGLQLHVYGVACAADTISDSFGGLTIPLKLYILAVSVALTVFEKVVGLHTHIRSLI